VTLHVRTGTGLHAGVTGKAISFGTTEFNYKERLVGESDAARGFLTGIWDQLTVSSVDNVPQAVRVFPWNLFNSPASDLPYGMAKTITPYAPTPRGCTYALVVAVLRAAEWVWVSVDPRGTGVARLSAPGALLEVWQDRKACVIYDFLFSSFHCARCSLFSCFFLSVCCNAPFDGVPFNALRSMHHPSIVFLTVDISPCLKSPLCCDVVPLILQLCALQKK
jgi:hypothetical protein